MHNRLARDMLLLLSDNEPTFWLDRVSGNDSKNGLTSGTAVLTMAQALTLLDAAGGTGTIRITAPVTAPVTGFFTLNSGVKTFVSADGNPWYLARSVVYSSGWTDAGGGIYTRATTQAGRVVIRTLDDGNGYWTVLTRNTSTPTTPAAGEYGHPGAGTLYVHLPGDADPNSHTIWQAQTASLITINSTGRLNIHQCIAAVSNGSTITVAGSAVVNAYNCQALYGDTGFSAASTSNLSAYACLGARNSNDGFSNNDSAIMYLNGCEAAYNNDEGISPHGTSQLTVIGGRSHHNDSGGITAIDTSIMHLTDVTSDYNGQNPPGAGIELGHGFVFGAGTSGTITDCIAQNNAASGYYCLTTPGLVTVTNLTSGIAEGNGDADVTC